MCKLHYGPLSYGESDGTNDLKIVRTLRRSATEAKCRRKCAVPLSNMICARYGHPHCEINHVLSDDRILQTLPALTLTMIRGMSQGFSTRQNRAGG